MIADRFDRERWERYFEPCQNIDIGQLDKNTIHPRDDAPTMVLHKREPTDIELHCVFSSFFNHVYSLDIDEREEGTYEAVGE